VNTSNPKIIKSVTFFAAALTLSASNITIALAEELSLKGYITVRPTLVQAINNNRLNKDCHNYNYPMRLILDEMDNAYYGKDTQALNRGRRFYQEIQQEHYMCLASRMNYASSLDD
jgi:hypothetical protein